MQLIARTPYAARTRRSAARASRRGTALVAALIVVGFVAVISVAYLELGMAKNREMRGSVDGKRAFYIAEAGISEAVLGLATGQSGNVANELIPAQYANGMFWVEAEESADGRVQLKSTGMCGTGRTSISIVVEPSPTESGVLGVFGAQALTIGAGSRLVGFDSRIGPTAMLPSSASAPRARLGSNGDITLPESKLGIATLVDGDVQPGPSGAVVRGRSVSITGSQAPRTTPATFPEVQVPSLATREDIGSSVGSQSRSKAKTAITIDGDGHYRSIHLAAGTTLTIRGPARIAADRFVVESDASVEMDPTAGSVTLFVTEWLRFAAKSTFTTKDKDPTQVRIYALGATSLDRDGDGVVDAPVSIQSTGDLYGALFAPHAALTWPASMLMHGSVAALDLSVDAGATMYFDVALLVPPKGATSHPSLSSWRLVEVPPTELTRLRVDPLLIFKLSGIVPPKAKNAHYEVGVDPKGGVTPPTLHLPKAGH